MSAAFETALEFARHGHKVFPTHWVIDGRCSCGKPSCGSPGKHPLGWLVPNGSKDATVDEGTLLRWDDQNPDANWAVACGSDMSVIDIDPKNGADPREVIPDHGLEGRPTVRSGLAVRGLVGEPGAHVYCAGGVNAEHTAVAGVGVRGGNQYVLLPGSRHVSGVAYEWVGDERPWNARLEPVPESLRPPAGGGGAGRGEFSAPDLIPHGQRHEALKDAAVRFLRAGWTDVPTLESMLKLFFEARCVQQPPPRRDEFRKLAEWATRTNMADRERHLAENPVTFLGASRNGAAAEPATAEVDPDVRQRAEARLVDMTDAMRRAAEPLDYLCRPLAARGFLTVLAGRPGEAKSWLLLAIAHAVHSGTDWVAGFGGLRCRAGRALYVDAENGPRLMGRRFTLMGLAADGVVVADATGLRLPEHVAELEAMIESTGPDFVALDSMRRLAPGVKENDSDEVAPLVAELARIARQYNVALVLIHHRSTKQGAADVRGSSAIEDQADLVFVLERVREDPERRTRRRLRCSKDRIDPEPEPVWLQITKTAGFVTIAGAEPFERSDEGDDEESAVENVAERIRALAEQVAADEDGWAPSRIAEAVDRTSRDGTFKRAWDLLVAEGEWEGTGNTSNRRYRPLRPSASAPIGDDLSGLSQVEPLFDSDGRPGEGS